LHPYYFYETILSKSIGGALVGLISASENRQIPAVINILADE